MITEENSMNALDEGYSDPYFIDNEKFRQAISKKPKIEDYCPQEEEQLKHKKWLLQVMDSWIEMTDFLKEYFISVKESHQSLEKKSKAMGIKATSKMENLGPLSSIIKMDLDATSAQSTCFIAFVDDKLLRLKALSKETQILRKNVKKEIETEFTRILSIRTDTLSFVKHHMQAVHRGDNAQSRTSGCEDPWFTEACLRSQLEFLVKEENRFQKKMQQVLMEVTDYNDKHSIMLCKIVKDYYEEAARTVQYYLSHFGEADILNVANNVNPLNGWPSKASLQNMNMSVWTEERVPSSLPLSNLISWDVNSGVLLQGMLRQRGKIMKSHWKVRNCILTTTGFLHCFRVPQQGEEEEDSSDSETTLKDNFCCSINLRQPGVTLALTMDHGLPSCFEITQPPPKRHLRGTTYVLKASSDEDLSNWMSLVKQTIEHYIPKGPPKALFTASAATFCQTNSEPTSHDDSDTL